MACTTSSPCFWGVKFTFYGRKTPSQTLKANQMLEKFRLPQLDLDLFFFYPPAFLIGIPLCLKRALLPISLSVWSSQSHPGRLQRMLTVYLESFILNIRLKPHCDRAAFSFLGTSPRALFKDIKARRKGKGKKSRCMFEQTNQNAKSTVVKRK